MSGVQVRGRPRLGWMDGVKVAFGNRRMTVETARCFPEHFSIPLMPVSRDLN